MAQLDGPDDPPVACTLAADELTDRRTLWGRIEPGVISRVRRDDALLVSYRSDPLVRELLPTLVRAEATCCAFADWELTAHEEDILLTITGPPAGLDALAAEFGLEPAPGPNA
jgi:hypothetical protein